MQNITKEPNLAGIPGTEVPAHVFDDTTAQEAVSKIIEKASEHVDMPFIDTAPKSSPPLCLSEMPIEFPSQISRSERKKRTAKRKNTKKQKRKGRKK